jgi:hypothetical protein
MLLRNGPFQALRRSWSVFPPPELLIAAGKRTKRLDVFAKADRFLVRSEISRAKSRQVLTLIRLLRALESQLDRLS